MPHDLRAVLPLDSRLDNAEVGVLLDAPLLINPTDEDLVLTSDEWASLLLARRAAGRAVHFVEVGGQGAEEDRSHDRGARTGVNVAQGGEGQVRGRHGRHRARLRVQRTTMKRAAFRGAA